MGINLCIANNLEECKLGKELENVRLEDSLQDFLRKNREILGEHQDVFLKLEPYDDMILSKDEIASLKLFSETLLDLENISMLDFSKEHTREWEYVSKEEYLMFAGELQSLCDKAILMGKLIYSLGD